MREIASIRSHEDVVVWCRDFFEETDGLRPGVQRDRAPHGAERCLLMSLVGLLLDWFPPKDMTVDGLLTLLSMAEARVGDPEYVSPLGLLFLQIEEGSRYVSMAGPEEATSHPGLTRNFAEDDPTWGWLPSRFRRNSDGREPGRCGGLSPDEDFSLGCWCVVRQLHPADLALVVADLQARVLDHKYRGTRRERDRTERLLFPALLRAVRKGGR